MLEDLGDFEEQFARCQEEGDTERATLAVRGIEASIANLRAHILHAHALEAEILMGPCHVAALDIAEFMHPVQ